MFDSTGPVIPARPRIFYSDDQAYAGSLEARLAWLEGRAAARRSNPTMPILDAFFGGGDQVGPPLARRPLTISRDVVPYIVAMEQRMYWLEGQDSVRPAERTPEPERTEADAEAEAAAAVVMAAGLAIAGLLKIGSKALTAVREHGAGARMQKDFDEAKAEKPAEAEA